MFKIKNLDMINNNNKISSFNSVILHIKNMLNKEKKHFKYLKDNNAPLNLINNSKERINHFKKRIKEYNKYKTKLK